MLKYLKIQVIFVLVLCGGLFLFAQTSLASSSPDLLVYDQELKLEKELNIVPSDFSGSLRFQTIDLQGAGNKQLAVALGNQDQPTIQVFDFEGELQNQWQPYAPGFTGEISLAVADLDGDGREEIIAGPGAGGGPQIRIFNGQGQALYTFGFWAHNKDYRGGVEVTAGDVNGDSQKEIIVSVIEGSRGWIKFFSRFGEEIGQPIEIELENNFEPVKIEAVDLGSDGIEEVIVGLGSGNSPKIKIFRRDGSLIKEFFAYHPGFGGGVNFSVAKTTDKNIIVTGAGYSGGPHVRFFDSFGELIDKPAFFAYDEEFRGGVNVDYSDIDNDGKLELITMPQQIEDGGKGFLHKYIDIDISEQKLKYYQNGKLVDQYIISSGLKSMPTPLGEFKIWQKSPRAYSARYGLYMPWWMSFKPSYGLHELPEWPNGYKEGENHLGKAVSHGCVRLGVGPAEALYKWAPISTPVIIHE